MSDLSKLAAFMNNAACQNAETLTCCHIEYSCKDLYCSDTPGLDELATLIRELNPIAGWIWQMGEPVYFRSPDELRITGFPMKAEFALSEHESGEIEHIGSGHWVMRTVSENTQGKANALMQDVKHLSAAEKSRMKSHGKSLYLKYRRYWTANDDGLVTIKASRFCGFEEVEV